MKTVAIYLRVSTQEQTEGYSLDEQKAKLLSYCTIMDYKVHDVYIDPGYSGSNLDRPAIRQLMDHVDEFDFVLVYKLDRLSRSQKDTLYLIEDVFLPKGVNLISLSESFDTSTPFGRAMVGILSVFAQLERENIKERMSLGKAGRAKSGLFNPGAVKPTGYDYVDGKLVINEYEAMQIRMICDMFIAGEPVNAIRNKLLKLGYTDNFKSSQTVYNMLRTPLIRGKIRYKQEGVFEGQHEAIIDEETGMKLDAELERRAKQEQGGLFKANYLLSGILRCGICGSKIAVQSMPRKKVYRCYSVSKSCKHMIRDENCTNIKIWAVADMDALIKHEIEQLAYNPTVYAQVKTVQHADSRQEIINNRLKEINAQIGKLMDLYQYDSIPFAEIRKRIDEAVVTKKALELQLSQIKQTQRAETLDQNTIINMAYMLIKQWNILDVAEKRKILGFLIEKIIVVNENVDIHWNF